MTEARAAIDAPQRIGFQDRIGLVLTERTESEIWGHLDIQPDHLNRSGIVHGGVYCTALDATLTGSGLWCPHPGRVRRAVTLSLTVKFTGRATGGRILLHATRVASGRRIYTAVGEATSEDGDVLAHAMGSFQYHPGSVDPEGESEADLRAAAAAAKS